MELLTNQKTDISISDKLIKLSNLFNGIKIDSERYIIKKRKNLSDNKPLLYIVNSNQVFKPISSVYKIKQENIFVFTLYKDNKKQVYFIELFDTIMKIYPKNKSFECENYDWFLPHSLYHSGKTAKG